MNISIPGLSNYLG
jgi:hypothetical protein